MKIFEALNEKTSFLSKNGQTHTARLDCEIILAYVLGCERIQLLIDSKNELPSDSYALFSELVERRANEEPVSYITGEKEFMSLKFKVKKGVLIPRPDTEILAEYAIEELKSIKGGKVLDLCTGSGALCVAIAKYVEDCSAVGVDFSDICVEIAGENAEQNSVFDRVKIIKQDIMCDFSLDERFDILVSNPPYIKKDVLKSLDATVKEFEPHTALDGGIDGLAFYRRICDLVPFLLKKGGIIAMELGYDQYDEVKKILEDLEIFEDIGYIRDLAGIKRVIKARYV